jgi:DNA N-6-adenine-methyltransferase Dam
MRESRPMTTGSAISSDDWCTPKWLAETLGLFALDPCSNKRSHVSAAVRCMLNHDTPEQRNGLVFDWADWSVFVNPPYSNVGPWAAKLAAHEGPWCALVKLDPSTKWWATLMTANPAIAPFRKRIRFEGDKAMTANFPSALVFSAWRPSRELEQHLWISRYA